MTKRTSQAGLCWLSLSAILAIAWPAPSGAQEILYIPGPPPPSYTGFNYGGQLGGRPSVLDVAKCSPADRAGLRVGDVILVFDGRDTGEAPLFRGSSREPGTVYVMTVRRGEEKIEIVLTSTEPLAKDEKPADRCEEGGRPSG